MKLTEQQLTPQSFVEALETGIEHIKLAASILVELSERDPKVIDKIRKLRPNLPENLLYNLQRVGRNQMRAELLYDDSPAAKKLAHLPYSVQSEAYENPIAVAHLENDQIVLVNKQVRDLTPKEVGFVFGSNRILDTDEQVKMLKQRQVVSRFKPAERYHITEHGTVAISAGTEFTEAQLEEILAKLRKQNIEHLESTIKRQQVKKL